MSVRGRVALASGAFAASSLITVGLLLTFLPRSLPDTVGMASVDAGPAAHSSTRTVARIPAPSDVVDHLPIGVDFLRDYQEASHSMAASPATSEGFQPGDPIVEWLDPPAERPQLFGPLRIEYAMDAELSGRILKVLERGRVVKGHVLVMDPSSGRLLAYTSTDPVGFPASRAYPAASLVKVVTAAAALHYAPQQARATCRYRGNPYRLTRSRLEPPAYGNEASLERALATSNNQCFAQLAVNAVGTQALLAAFGSFGLLESPAPGHAAGVADAGEDDYGLGKLGSGLGGSRMTPLHAVQLAGVLASGERVEPWWIDRVLDARGHVLDLPQRRPPQRVMTKELAQELREMLVRTTTRGTARSAFRDRRGRPKLGAVRVAGKTGNLSGRDPKGRYEWFMAVAPAEEPTVAIAVVQLHGHLWWSKSSQVAADVLQQIFCERGRCSNELAARYTGRLGRTAAPVFLSATGS